MFMGDRPLFPDKFNFIRIAALSEQRNESNAAGDEIDSLPTVCTFVHWGYYREKKGAGK